MRKLRTWTPIVAALAAAFAFPPLLSAQPLLTPEQVASLQLVTSPPPRGTFWVWSYARSNVFSLNPFPFNPFPADVPVYALDAS